MDKRIVTMNNLEYYNSKLQEKFKEVNERMDRLESEVANLCDTVGRMNTAEVSLSEFKMMLGGFDE
jgi:predicted nuclease with TOPRIM domain